MAITTTKITAHVGIKFPGEGHAGRSGRTCRSPVRRWRWHVEVPAGWACRNRLSSSHKAVAKLETRIMTITQTTVTLAISIGSPGAGDLQLGSNITVIGAIRPARDVRDGPRRRHLRGRHEPVHGPGQVRGQVRLRAVPERHSKRSCGAKWQSFEFTALTPTGPAQLPITAEIALGSQTETDTVTVALDTVGPSITINEPTDAKLVALPSADPTAQVNLAVSASVNDAQSGVKKVEAAVDGAAFVAATAQGTGGVFTATVPGRPRPPARSRWWCGLPTTRTTSAPSRSASTWRCRSAVDPTRRMPWAPEPTSPTGWVSPNCRLAGRSHPRAHPGACSASASIRRPPEHRPAATRPVPQAGSRWRRSASLTSQHGHPR